MGFIKPVPGSWGLLVRVYFETFSRVVSGPAALIPTAHTVMLATTRQGSGLSLRGFIVHFFFFIRVVTFLHLKTRGLVFYLNKMPNCRTNGYLCAEKPISETKNMLVYNKFYAGA